MAGIFALLCLIIICSVCLGVSLLDKYIPGICVSCLGVTILALCLCKLVKSSIDTNPTFLLNADALEYKGAIYLKGQILEDYKAVELLNIKDSTTYKYVPFNEVHSAK